MSEHADAIVVGGGAVGAALALALARERLEVLLVDPRPPAPWRDDAPRDLRTYALSPASIAMLDRLGVWATVAARRASPYERLGVWEGDDEPLIFDAALIGERRLGAIVEDSALRTALWERMAAEPRIRVHAPDAVEALDSARRDRVELHLSRGAVLSAPVALAADGAESVLRRLAGLAIATESYGERAIVANVRTERGLARTAWQRFTPDGPLAFLPLDDGGASIVWSVRDARADALLALDAPTFERELEGAFSHRLGAVRLESERVALVLRLRLAPVYAATRVALVGDAAHVVHPLAGQGLNLGLLDAAACAEVLGAARGSGIDPGAPEVLARYARWRQADNVLAARAFDLLDAGFRSDAPGASWLRRTGLRAVSQLAPLRREFALQASGWSGRVPRLAARPS